jgi:hypothetical protein
MSVIWLRLRDCMGLQWKHAVLALQLLRNLLYHGPLTAVTEATDGLHKIRSLKYYENIRPVCAQQVSAAVYGLLVDRATLFTVRRTCADRRRKLHDPSQCECGAGKSCSRRCVVASFPLNELYLTHFSIVASIVVYTKPHIQQP